MFEAVQFIERRSAAEPAETPLGEFEKESVLDLRSGELMEVPTA